MKFWKFSLPVLSCLLAAVAASGPTDGDAIADPNSAVVKLTAAEYSSFIDENPLVLAEFFAPWCGYCKQLAPEFVAAADSLAETHPGIKLAQIDCTEEETLCQEQQIKGYPTLKIIRGDQVEDYEGPRMADGIVDYMVEQTKPVVQAPESVEDLDKLLEEYTSNKNFVVQVLPSDAKNSKKLDAAFTEIAQSKRKDLLFITVSSADQIDALAKKLTNHKLKAKGLKNAHYYLVRAGGSLEDASEIASSSKKFDAEALKAFIETEVVPYFGEIDRDTYMLYMNSPLPIGYYFYNDVEQKESVRAIFEKLGKKHRGSINFVALDATQFGRHAETLNMDETIVPLFAIQKVSDNEKYGINQQEHPNPSVDVIEQFVADFFDNKLTALTKSEDLPTDEEIAASPVVKLVGHNHADIVGDVSKDVFVKYYAPWCGHCKTLAPKWEELAEIFVSNRPDAEIVIADLDHTANDVKIPFDIEGYPTLVLYPANGEIDEATGIRKPVVFRGNREVDDLTEFISAEGGNKVDVEALKASFEEVKEKREAAAKEAADAEEEVAQDEEATEEIDDEL